MRTATAEYVYPFKRSGDFPSSTEWGRAHDRWWLPLQQGLGTRGPSRRRSRLLRKDCAQPPSVSAVGALREARAHHVADDLQHALVAHDEAPAVDSVFADDRLCRPFG